MVAMATVFGLNSVIRGCGAVQQWQRALALLFASSETLNSKCRLIMLPEPNLVSFSAGALVCVQSLRWATALALFSPFGVYRVQLYCVACNICIDACGTGSFWQGSLSVIMDMCRVSLEPDEMSFNTALRACERGCKTEIVLALSDAMFASHVLPNAISFGTVATACSRNSGARSRVARAGADHARLPRCDLFFSNN